MSEALATYTAGSIEKVWSNPVEIKALVAPQLTDSEFSYFMGLSKATGMNPLMREIWAVKYGNSAAQIFIGRDGYRRKAQELPEYEGHTASAIYENDKFEVDNGIPHHWFGIQNRGKVIGAYCIVYVKGRKVPFLEVVDVNEYNTGKSNWAKMPATMIKKVAEAQALRGAFQGTFGGTHEESEQWDDTQKPIDVKPQPSQEQLEKAYAAIEALTPDEHPAHSRNSCLLWLNAETLRECKDIEMLRAYYAHKKEQANETAKKEQETMQKEKDNIDSVDLHAMSETVEKWLPERFEEFAGYADKKNFVLCQSIFDEALKHAPVEQADVVEAFDGEVVE